MTAVNPASVLCKTMYILQGAPGSGKSIMAEAIAEWESIIGEPRSSVLIVSTDHERLQECGHYIHDAAQNADHHRVTQKKAVQAAQTHVRVLIIDNTNITREHANPYLVIANIWGYTPQVVRVDPGLQEALRRNRSRDANRRVPDGVVERMYNAMEDLL